MAWSSHYSFLVCFQFIGVASKTSLAICYTCSFVPWLWITDIFCIYNITGTLPVTMLYTPVLTTQWVIDCGNQCYSYMVVAILILKWMIYCLLPKWVLWEHWWGESGTMSELVEKLAKLVVWLLLMCSHAHVTLHIFSMFDHTHLTIHFRQKCWQVMAWVVPMPLQLCVQDQKHFW